MRLVPIVIAQVFLEYVADGWLNLQFLTRRGLIFGSAYSQVKKLRYLANLSHVLGHGFTSD